MAGSANTGNWGVRSAIVALAMAAAQAVACPFCNPNLTITERINEAHCCYAVEWVSGVRGDADRGETGSTDVRVTHVFKNGEPLRQVGEVITLPDYSAGQPGERSLLYGKLRIEEQRGCGTTPEAAAQVQVVEKLGWDGLVPVTEEVIDYVAARPSFEIKSPARLPYFLPFLEHPNETIAVDAYSEFGNSPYEAVKSMAPQFDREKLVRWVSEPDAGTGRIARIGFYGLVLGLCGGEPEAQALERFIHAPLADDYRLGIDGIMAGYLFLRGPAGLDVLKAHALAPDMPASELYALMQAVKFHWEFGDGRLAKDDLRATLRPLTENPQFADLAIVDLTRWEDFTVVDRLIELYSQPKFDNLETQTAIARYYLAIAALDPAGRAESDAAAIRRAQSHLTSLRQRDGELVDRAERLYRAPDTALTNSTTAAGSPGVPTLAVSAGGAESAATDDGAGYSPRLLLLALVFAAAVLLATHWRDRIRATPRGE